MGKVHKENGQDNDEKGFQFESEPASEHEFDGSRSSSNYAHWHVHVSFPGLFVRYQDEAEGSSRLRRIFLQLEEQPWLSLLSFA